MHKYFLIVFLLFGCGICFAAEPEPERAKPKEGAIAGTCTLMEVLERSLQWLQAREYIEKDLGFTPLMDWISPGKDDYKPEISALLALKDLLEKAAEGAFKWEKKRSQDKPDEKIVQRGMLVSIKYHPYMRYTFFTALGSYRFTRTEEKEKDWDIARWVRGTLFQNITVAQAPARFLQHREFHQIIKVGDIPLPPLELTARVLEELSK